MYFKKNHKKIVFPLDFFFLFTFKPEKEGIVLSWKKPLSELAHCYFQNISGFFHPLREGGVTHLSPLKGILHMFTWSCLSSSRNVPCTGHLSWSHLTRILKSYFCCLLEMIPLLSLSGTKMEGKPKAVLSEKRAFWFSAKWFSPVASKITSVSHMQKMLTDKDQVLKSYY